jgi:hypothetical protein
MLSGYPYVSVHEAANRCVVVKPSSGMRRIFGREGTKRHTKPIEPSSRAPVSFQVKSSLRLQMTTEVGTWRPRRNV